MTLERSDEVQKQMRDYIRRLHESPIMENRMVAVLMDDPEGRFCIDEPTCRAKVRKLVTIYEDESPGDLLARKRREREEFEKTQDADFKLRLLTEFLFDAGQWNLGPAEEKARALWMERLKRQGIVPRKPA